MQLVNRIAAWTAFAGFAVLAVPACAQEMLDELKPWCDKNGFARGTLEHADCVRKIDAQQAQPRC